MRLVVEVVGARDLMPKDGEGSASPFVEVDFEDQRARTRTVHKDLNAAWNQQLLFRLDDPEGLRRRGIDVCVYHERPSFPWRSFLGRVRVHGCDVVREGEETLQSFPLERKWFFSYVRGDVSLKVYTSPKPYPTPSPSPPAPPSVSRDNTSATEAIPATAHTTPGTAATIETPNTAPPSATEKNALPKIVSQPSPSPSFVPPSPAPSPAKETEDIKETIEVKLATGATQHIHKQQVSPPQPGRSVVEEERGTEGVLPSITMHHHHQANHQPPPAHAAAHHDDFQLKDTSPQLGERWPVGRGSTGWLGAGGVGWSSSGAGDKLTGTYDLVEQVYYLYVRVVKAKELPASPITGSCDPYAEVKLGNYRGTTRHFEKRLNPEWNQVFAFSKDRIQSTTLEVFVKDREMVGRDDYLGRVAFDLNEVPTRVPPDSPLAPQWYRLEDRRGEGKVRGEVMLAVWMGTQADEAFPEAWHADAAALHGEGVHNTRSKVYVSPKLWYLRVNVIEAQDVQPLDRGRVAPEVFVKAQVGTQVLKTRPCATRTMNPMWNEDLVFVAAEPFEEQLVVTVEDRVHPAKDEVLGKLTLPLTGFERRLDHRPVHSQWFNMEKFGFGALEGDRRKELKFSSRVHLRVCLEGAYHVMDESTMYISDQRPTARQLWKPPVGVLEVGVLGARGLLPLKARDGRGVTDAYCVAKYGQKWVRTRTVLDRAAPRWNEQYTWEVYDPCTVITLGVFDNCHLGGGPGDRAVPPGTTKDLRIGKVRIRLSTLETDRIYTHSYPLMVLQPSGLKKMGELQLAVRFTCLSLVNMVHLYGHPPLPKMHYVHPFTVTQLDSLRYQAMGIVAARLGRAEPPLRREVVEYMLDADSHMWSMRRSKANFFRVMALLSGAIGAGRWLGEVRQWRNPVTTVLVHVLFLILVWYPELILPTVFLYMFLIGLWNYRFRPRHPPHMDTRLSWADAVHPDELDEEFDTFPTSKPQDVVRLRYDRLRSVAGRIQTVVGDMATQGERLQSLLSWRDPRATCLFVVFCLCAAVALYVTPFRVVALLAGLYLLRHPRFRSKLPSVPSNFFKRLPSRIDSML